MDDVSCMMCHGSVQEAFGFDRQDSAYQWRRFALSGERCHFHDTDVWSMQTGHVTLYSNGDFGAGCATFIKAYRHHEGTTKICNCCGLLLQHQHLCTAADRRNLAAGLHSAGMCLWDLHLIIHCLLRNQHHALSIQKIVHRGAFIGSTLKGHVRMFKEEQKLHKEDCLVVPRPYGSVVKD